MCTHESFVQGIKALAVEKCPDLYKDKLALTKLVYGLGRSGLRGITHFGKWSDGDKPLDLAEVCAFGEHDETQLAGTTLHELAHVIAGPGAGHGKAWKDACKMLGLRKCSAAGQRYTWAVFDPDVRMALVAMRKPDDGKPSGTDANGGQVALKPCLLGIGTRGGKSRGVGSGSRMRKYMCDCGQIIRAGCDDLEAVHSCGSAFKLA